MGCRNSVQVVEIDNDIINLDAKYQLKIPKNKKEIKKYIPDIKNAFVIKVYDGDTITIAYHLNNDTTKCYKASTRLRRIDCPEIKTKNQREKEMALRAKLLVSNLCLDKVILLENIGYDKYGRLLSEIIIKNSKLVDRITNADKKKLQDFVKNKSGYDVNILKNDNILKKYIEEHGINISDFLIFAGLAVEYNGGKKIKEW